jgi:hypothetical protein
MISLVNYKPIPLYLLNLTKPHKKFHEPIILLYDNK